ncbi:MAG: tyrosine-type recombinase/integrase [Hyphomicrobium sp.]|nr:tyrosine-type recombinase/integrase [Hyphomicrobium sp.]
MERAAMSRLQFTDLGIRALKPPEQGQVTHWDASLPGFGIRISQGGTKTWIAMRGEERRRVTIGRYPDMSLQEARGVAWDLLRRKQRKGSGVALRFGEAVDTFLSTHCAVKNRPSTAKETERLLRRHFEPEFKTKLLEDITTEDVMRVVDEVLERPAAARHVFTAGRTFFRWAVRRRYLQHSPVEGLQLPTRPVSRDRVLSDRELARIYEVARDRGHPFGTIVELLILTGQRRGEIGAMRRAFIDADSRVISLPASLTKNGREHAFPFGELAERALKEALLTGDFLFAARGTDDRAFNGWSKSKLLFDRQCKIDHWTLHDLRRTFSTIQARIGTPPHITERILNHQTGTLTAIAKIYNRYSYMDEMREAMRRYEQEILRILSTEKT